MIRGTIAPAPAGFARRLSERARAAAEASAESALRDARRDPLRWRLPRLLWPQFTKG